MIAKHCTAVHEGKLISFIENRCAGVKGARMYQITASAAVRSEVRLRCLQRSGHTRLKRDRKTDRALSSSVFRERCRSKVRVRAGAGGGLLCRSRHSKIFWQPHLFFALCASQTGREGQLAVGRTSGPIPTHSLLPKCTPTKRVQH